MAFLNENEKKELEAKIAHAESQTRAEIVTVIAGQSDGYRYIPILWSALLALSIPGFYYAYLALTAGGWVAPEQMEQAGVWLYSIQVLVFLGVGMLLQIPAARMAIIPEKVKKQRASRHAREQFFLQNLHQTQGHTGVLVFVSVAEHYVEIIVDSAIAAAVDDKLWEQTVDNFISHIGRGEVATGFDTTIEQCRIILCEHFPVADHHSAGTGPADGDPEDKQTADGKLNELPNHLIEV